MSIREEAENALDTKRRADAVQLAKDCLNEQERMSWYNKKLNEILVLIETDYLTAFKMYRELYGQISR